MTTAAKNTGTGTAITITHGLTINDNDLVIAFISQNGSGNTITDNNGGDSFSPGIEADQSSATYKFFEKLASSEPSSYAFTSDATGSWTIFIIVIPGVYTASYWDVEPELGVTENHTSSNTNPAEAPAITTNYDNSIGLYITTSDSSGLTYSSPTQSFSELIQDPGGRSAAVYIKTFGSAGSQGAVSTTMDTDNDYVAHQIAVRMAAGATTSIHHILNQ